MTDGSGVYHMEYNDCNADRLGEKSLDVSDFLYNKPFCRMVTAPYRKLQIHSECTGFGTYGTIDKPR